MMTREEAIEHIGQALEDTTGEAWSDEDVERYGFDLDESDNNHPIGRLQTSAGAHGDTVLVAACRIVRGEIEPGTVTRLVIDRDDDFEGYFTCDCQYARFSELFDEAEREQLEKRWPHAEIDVRVHRNTSGFGTRITADIDGDDDFDAQPRFWADYQDAAEAAHMAASAGLDDWDPDTDCECSEESEED